MQKPQNKQFFSTLFLNKKLQVYPTWKTKSTNVLLLANSTAPHNPQLWGSLYLLFMGVQHLVVGYAPCFIVYNAFNTCNIFFMGVQLVIPSQHVKVTTYSNTCVVLDEHDHAWT